MTQEEKMTKCFHVCNKWLYLKNNNIHILDYDDIWQRKIVIYGLGYLGKRLLEELKNDNAYIAYIVDKNADTFFTDYDMYKPEEKLADADIMIVTPIWAFDSIKKVCGKNFCGKIVSLEEVINHLWKNSWEKSW